MLGEIPGMPTPVADVVSKSRFLSPAAGGKEPRFRNRDMLGEIPGKLVPVADVVSKPRFLSPAAGGKEPRFRNRDMLGEIPGKLAPVADVVSKPRFLSPAAGGKEPRFRNRDMLGEIPGKLAPVADVVSKPRVISFTRSLSGLASFDNRGLDWFHMSSDAQQDFALAFLSILFEGAPFILLGTLISGFIDIYLPAGTMDRFLPKNRTLAVMVSGLLGAVFPVCECAVVPVIRRLVGKGLPVSCALTYMLAAPIVNPITALSTWKAFQGQAPWMMTGSRMLLGYLVAVGVGLVVARIPIRAILRKRLVDRIEKEPVVEKETHDHSCGSDHDHDHSHDHDHHHHEEPNDSRLIAAMRSAQKDFVDVGVYFTIGVAITALFNTGIAPGAEWLDSLAGNPLAAPAALMALAFILSLCSTSDAFIAATLAKFTWGAKLAFLVLGPMLDVKLIFLYQTVLTKKFIIGLSVSLFVVIWLASIAAQAWLIPNL